MAVAAATAAESGGVLPRRRVSCVEIRDAVVALSEEEAARAIVEAIQHRPSLALPVVSAICPELTFAPSKALTDRRMTGWIKSFNHSTGYGFIACPELHRTHGTDVFLHRAQVGGFAVDQEVSFAVFLNRYNKPQAFDLAPATGGGGSTWPAPPASIAQLWLQPSAAEAATPTSKAVTSAMAAAIANCAARGAVRPMPGVSQARCLPTDAAVASFGGPSGAAAAPAVATAAGSRAPAEAEGGARDGRYQGRLKSFSRVSGFGFIECPELHAEHQRDVFVHQMNVGDCRVGAQVEFIVFFNAKGQPQARDVREVDAGATGATSTAAVAAPAPSPPESTGSAGSGGGVSSSSTCPPPPSTRLCSAVADAVASPPAVAPGTGSHDDGLLDRALCVICQEVLHRATSVQPCLHNFCSACLGSWIWSAGHRRPQCPVCREGVLRITRNHTLDALVEGLLKLHPGRRRSDEDLAELDLQDMLQEAGYNLQLVREVRRRSHRRGQPRPREDRRPDERTPFSASPGDDTPWRDRPMRVQDVASQFDGLTQLISSPPALGSLGGQAAIPPDFATWLRQRSTPPPRPPPSYAAPYNTMVPMLALTPSHLQVGQSAPLPPPPPPPGDDRAFLPPPPPPPPGDDRAFYSSPMLPLQPAAGGPATLSWLAMPPSRPTPLRYSPGISGGSQSVGGTMSEDGLPLPTGPGEDFTDASESESSEESWSDGGLWIPPVHGRASSGLPRVEPFRFTRLEPLPRLEPFWV